jgi:hypothetical protein
VAERASPTNEAPDKRSGWPRALLTFAFEPSTGGLDALADEASFVASPYAALGEVRAVLRCRALLARALVKLARQQDGSAQEDLKTIEGETCRQEPAHYLALGLLNRLAAGSE